MKAIVILLSMLSNYFMVCSAIENLSYLNVKCKSNGYACYVGVVRVGWKKGLFSKPMFDHTRKSHLSTFDGVCSEAGNALAKVEGCKPDNCFVEYCISDDDRRKRNRQFTDEEFEIALSTVENPKLAMHLRATRFPKK